jgi:hypothetical protein
MKSVIWEHYVGRDDGKVTSVLLSANAKPSKRIAVEVCTQRLDKVGTAHAVHAARESVDKVDRFGVINSDDIYGRKSFYLLIDALCHGWPHGENRFFTVTFTLRNTMSKFGDVSRAIVVPEPGGPLVSRIVEREGLSVETIDEREPLLTSMNMWMFSKSIFRHIDDAIQARAGVGSVSAPKGISTPELRLPAIVGDLRRDDKITVEYVPSDAAWLGITHQGDIDWVRKEVDKLIKVGAYPSPLWSRVQQINAPQT